MVQFLILNVVLGVALGVSASYLFYLWLSRQTPRVLVSDKIARTRDSANGVIKHKIKLVNKTAVAIVDIKATLHVVCRTASGYNRTARLELKADSPLAIERFNAADKTAAYAYRFVVYELEEQIRRHFPEQLECFLRFRLVCRHSFSNFGAFVQRDYWLDKDVIDGDFRMGDTFEIVPDQHQESRSGEIPIRAVMELQPASATPPEKMTSG